ncbi:MAG: hypothetical protein M3161_06500, partial [Actinomycetota bacterium]|nr:hypothetical protein [Actinomycetota bacterium]
MGVTRVALAVLVSLLGCALALTGVSPVHAGATEASPPERVVVVTTNLQEAWSRQTDDLKDQSELDIYVQRLLDQLPYFPDVLLLQEVRRKSARYVKDLLTQETGDTYGWGVMPPRKPWRNTESVRIETDSAVLFNADAMRKLDDGGFISLTYKRSHAADQVERVERTQHARVSLIERDGDLMVAGASVHMQYGHLQERHIDRYQVQWTDKLAQVMADRYPDALRNIGGDFNQDRCQQPGSGIETCDKEPFWQNLTEAPWNYSDVIYEVYLEGKRVHR